MPTTAYLLEGERCSRDCAFCPQARSAVSRDDLLARVNWPEVTESAFWAGLARASDDRQLRRACFQLTASPGVMARVEREVRRLHELRPGLPICVSVAARNLEEIGAILGWGAERVTLALDAATTDLHRELKGGPLEPRLELLRRAAEAFPGHIGTHVIAGMGETERDLVGLLGQLHQAGVTVALFAFTPIPGTRLAGRKPPDLVSYRRLQAARYLIAGGHARAEAMSFDGQGRLASYGLPWEKVEAILAGGEAFRTSGCPDCNRPYYNERPSGPLYNYPRPLTAGEAARAVAEARPEGEAEPVSDTRPPADAGSPADARPPAEAAPPRRVTVRRVNIDATGFPAEATGGGETRPAGRQVWRLLIEAEPRTGAENMAVDEAILLAHAAGKVPPTLRFYRWHPAAVSLGYFQDFATDVDSIACREAGIDIVRRTTGGRAVLHDREVTYSVVIATDLLPGTVTETYRLLAGGLVLGLRRLGVDATMAPERRASRGAPEERAVADGACFEVPSSYEIVAGGRKIVGSAQVRRCGVILQHGSVPLELDAALLARVLGLGEAAGPRIAAKASGLDEPLGGRPPSYEEVCQAFTEGIGRSLGLDFARGDLTAEETLATERLVREKYGQEDWNRKKPRADAAAEGDGSRSAWGTPD